MSKSLANRFIGPYRISHHPLCDNFNDHVFIIRGKKVCRGCALFYPGVLLATIISTIGIFTGFWKTWTEIDYIISLYTLVIPTFLTTYLIKIRKLKDISRFMLGIAYTLTLFIVILHPNWLLKVIVLIHIIPGNYIMNSKRSQKNNEVCDKCDEKEERPYCSGYKEYKIREKIFTAAEAQGGFMDPFAVDGSELED